MRFWLSRSLGRRWIILGRWLSLKLITSGVFYKTQLIRSGNYSQLKRYWVKIECFREVLSSQLFYLIPIFEESWSNRTFQFMHSDARKFDYTYQRITRGYTNLFRGNHLLLWLDSTVDLLRFNQSIDNSGLLGCFQCIVFIIYSVTLSVSSGK